VAVQASLIRAGVTKLQEFVKLDGTKPDIEGSDDPNLTAGAGVVFKGTLAGWVWNLR
jgi:hypothetical protein